MVRVRVRVRDRVRARARLPPVIGEVEEVAPVLVRRRDAIAKVLP